MGSLPRYAALAAMLFASLEAAPPLHGQTLTPKTALEPDPLELCRPAPVPSLINTPSLAAVDSLLTLGTEAAILGDQEAAADALERAARLDPGNPIIAYRLARIYEERGELDRAAEEYCKYLRVAPNGSELPVVRERIRQLLSNAQGDDRDEVAAMVRAGLEALEGQRYSAAVRAFSNVIERRPTWAAAHYNRALARAAAGQVADAVADLDRYLELVPSSADRQLVQAFADSLRASEATRRANTTSAVTALAGGLVVPGLGQQLTRRPVAGLAVLGGTAAALWWGLREQEVTQTRTAQDPFGNPYEYEVVARERTYLVPGIAAAAGIAVAGALEAYLYARSRVDGPPASGAGALTTGGPLLRPFIRTSPAGERTELGLQIYTGGARRSATGR